VRRLTDQLWSFDEFYETVSRYNQGMVENPYEPPLVPPEPRERRPLWSWKLPKALWNSESRSSAVRIVILIALGAMLYVWRYLVYWEVWGDWRR
jgi:hypothetical protein